MKKALLIIQFLLASLVVLCQANGKFQLHFMDVGQADAAVLISPKGEIVIFDVGVSKFCDMPVSYLEQLGIKNIDYLVISHFHDDHIGCTHEVLSRFPLQKTAFDRGSTYPSTSFKRYAQTVGSHRKTAIIGDSITLDVTTKNPVIIKFIASNGAGIITTNENDLSLISVIHFGNFDVAMGGDLSGIDADNYRDIESVVLKNMQQVEVYKVHHHGSKYSSNENWLKALKPKIGIISASGTIGKNYNHPTDECLERLHLAGIKNYWTEIGGGVNPDPAWDVVGGNIVLETAPNSDKFTVTYNWNKVDTFSLWKMLPSNELIPNTYCWSKNSNFYHYIDCRYVSKINPSNLEKGNTIPSGKKLHEGCPK